MRVNNQSPRQNPLIAKLTEHLFPVVVVFLFSVCLIGGGSYLFFGVERDINDLDELLMDFDRSHSEMSMLNSMLGIVETGSVLDTTEYDRLYSTLSAIIEKHHFKKLPDSLSKDALEWCIESLRKLTFERGIISGFFLKNDLYKSYRDNVLQLYDCFIQTLRQVNKTIGEWDLETPVQRSSRFESVQSVKFEFIGKISALKASVLQMKSWIDLAEKEHLRKVGEAKVRTRIIARKIALAVIGVLVGGFFLIRTSVSMWRTSFKPTKTKKKKT